MAIAGNYSVYQRIQAVKMEIRGEMSQRGADISGCIVSAGFACALVLIAWGLPEIIRSVRWW